MTDIRNALNSLRARQMGSYFICDCPKCGQHEAYIYIDDVNKLLKDGHHRVPIRCNRQNRCGETSYLNDIAETDGPAASNAPIQPKSSVEMTSEGIHVLDAYFGKNIQHKVEFSYRGISAANLTAHHVVYEKRTLLGLFNATERSRKMFWGRKYQTASYRNRDMLFPVYDDKGTLVRILLRTRDPKMSPAKKEIQVIVRENTPEIWNIQDLLDPEKKIVFITEGAYDAMSITEVCHAPNVGVISISGVGKYRQIIRMIKKHEKETAGKIFILAFDNDPAGNRTVAKAMTEFSSAGLCVLRYLPLMKDCNESLQAGREAFAESLCSFFAQNGMLGQKQTMRKPAYQQTAARKSQSARASQTYQRHTSGKAYAPAFARMLKAK